MKSWLDKLSIQLYKDLRGKILTDKFIRQLTPETKIYMTE